MTLRALRDACLRGFVYGSVLYGAVLSVIHLVHNRVGSVRDALIVFAVFGLLYGLWAAAFFGLARLAAGFFSRPEARERRGLFWGLLAFNLVFWEILFLYGLTYDQAPFGPAGAWGMAGVLLGLALLIALAVVAGSWVLFRLIEAPRGRRRLAAGVAALAAVALLVNVMTPLVLARETAAGQQTPPAIHVADTGLKVVLVGLDGADWRVIRPLMAKGELPAFAALMREGASGDLATLHDSNSAVIWASIYTGAIPERHGIDDFYRISLPGMTTGLFPVHRTYFKELADLTAPLGLARQIPVDRFSLKLPPIWEIADRAGLTTGVVDGYFYSFPALRPSRPESWFFTYGLDLLAERASPRAELFVQPKQLFRDVRPLLNGGDFYWQSATLLEMLAKRPQPRFVNFYTHEPDSAQHFYWKWWEPRRYFGVTGKGLRENAERIPRLHRDFDAFLARLRQQVGPDTVIVVASDHGHSPTIVHSLYTQHRHGPPGIVMMQGGPVKRGAVLQGADIYDLYPTLLYLLGLPVPRDIQGKILIEALDPAFVRAHPVRAVPSYAGLGLSPGIPGASRDGEMNEAEIEKLKALGYIF
jgi:hypothetical protein